MHEPVIESLEVILAGRNVPGPARDHLNECVSCREEVAAMRKQQILLSALKAPAGVEPRVAFYARVMDRIETQARPSIWSIFGESVFAKRLAYASMTFVALLGTYMISSTRSENLSPATPETILAGDQTQYSDATAENTERDRETILVTLATYEE